MSKVFISYSSKQAQKAEAVCNFLESRGVSCWMAPRNIDPGSNYASQIVRAIRESSALILLASEHTNTSGHVSNEVGLAFDNQKTIIPFKLEDVQFSDEYLYFLGRKHWIDAFKDFTVGLETLLQTLHNVLPESTKTPQLPVGFSAKDEESKEEIPESSPEVSRLEIISVLTKKTEKFSYSLFERFSDGVDRCEFEGLQRRCLEKPYGFFITGNLISPMWIALPDLLQVLRR